MTVIKLNGIEGLKKKLEAQQYKQDCNTILKRNAAELQDRIKTNMSAKYTGHYEWRKGKGRVFVKPTGATSKSVTIAYSDGGMKATVGPHTKYSPYLEYGTRFMAARPTVGPATRVQGPKFINDLENLGKAWGR